MELAAECYSLTKLFPREELVSLTSQIRRAAASIAANVAEGHGRENTGSFIQFLRVSQGSLKERETHLLLARKVGLCSQTSISSALDRADQIGRMLRSLIRSLQAKQGSD